MSRFCGEWYRVPKTLWSPHHAPLTSSIPALPTSQVQMTAYFAWIAAVWLWAKPLFCFPLFLSVRGTPCHSGHAITQKECYVVVGGTQGPHSVSFVLASVNSHAKMTLTWVRGKWYGQTKYKKLGTIKHLWYWRDFEWKPCGACSEVKLITKIWYTGRYSAKIKALLYKLSLVFQVQFLLEWKHFELDSQLHDGFLLFLNALD